MIHIAVHNYISKVVNDRWLMGILMTIDVLEREVLVDMYVRKMILHTFHLKKYTLTQVNLFKKMQIFLNRSLVYSIFQEGNHL